MIEVCIELIGTGKENASCHYTNPSISKGCFMVHYWDTSHVMLLEVADAYVLST